MPASPPPSQFFVEPAKVSAYLLNLNHPDGKSKATFFIGWGFDPTRPYELVTALVRHPSGAILRDVVESVWGAKFVYEGALAAPSGTTPPIISVWEVAPGDSVARLVTAYRF